MAGVGAEVLEVHRDVLHDAPVKLLAVGHPGLEGVRARGAGDGVVLVEVEDVTLGVDPVGMWPEAVERLGPEIDLPRELARQAEGLVCRASEGQHGVGDVHKEDLRFYRSLEYGGLDLVRQVGDAGPGRVRRCCPGGVFVRHLGRRERHKSRRWREGVRGRRAVGNTPMPAAGRGEVTTGGGGGSECKGGCRVWPLGSPFGCSSGGSLGKMAQLRSQTTVGASIRRRRTSNECRARRESRNAASRWPGLATRGGGGPIAGDRPLGRSSAAD